MSMFEFMKLSKKLDTILDSDVITNGAVKSVQIGVCTINKSTSATTKTITINSVDPDKCLVLLNISLIGNNLGSSLPEQGASLYSLKSTVLNIHCSTQTNRNMYVSWQVVEFY